MNELFIFDTFRCGVPETITFQALRNFESKTMETV